MITITNNMEQAMNADNPVLYFTAPWCQPCKALKPVMAKIGMQDDTHNYFVIDIEEIDKGYLDRFNIRSVPTIIKLDKEKQPTIIKSRTGSEILEEIMGA